MDDKALIRIDNIEDDLDRYEELLLRRDSLRKKAEQYQISYFKEFGDLIVQSFKLRVECIKKKKMIAYCQRLVNQGKSIDGAQLDHYIEREMADYQADLEMMIEHNKAVKASESVSEYDIYKIKKLYHSLAKLIHPDLHPEFAYDHQIQDYWNEIVLAYEHNRLEDLEELDFKVRKYLEDRDEAPEAVRISNLPGKIAKLEEEIDKITSTDPYLYRLLLEDEESITAKKNALQEEIDSFREYSKQLEEVISQFKIERNYS